MPIRVLHLFLFAVFSWVSLQAQVEPARDPRIARAVELGEQGNLCEDRKDFVKAEDYWKQSLELFLAIPDPSHAAEILNRLGGSAVVRGAYEEARVLLLRGLSLPAGDTALDHKNRAFLLHNLGFSYHRQKDWAKARDYYEQSIRHSQSTGFTRGEYLTQSNLAVLLGESGQPRRALETWQDLLRKKVEKPDPSGWSEPDIRGEIINLLETLQDRNGAITQAREAHARFKTIQDGPSEARFGRRLGELLKDQDPEAAVQAIQGALEVSRKGQDGPGVSAALVDLGNLHAAQNRREQAEACFQEDLALARASANRGEEGWALYRLGWLRKQFKAPEAALPLFDEALQVAQAAKDVGLERVVLKMKSRTLEDLRRFKEALEVDALLLTQCRAANDSRGVVEALRRMSDHSRGVDISLSVRSAEEAGGISGGLGDSNLQAESGRDLLWSLVMQGDGKKALKIGLEVLEKCRKVGDPALTATVEIKLGYAYHLVGESQKGIVHGESALDYWRARPEKGDGLMGALWELGLIYGGIKDYSKEESLLQEALALARSRGDWVTEEKLLDNLGNAAGHRQDVGQALACYQQSMAILSAHGEAPRGGTLHNLAGVLRSLCRYEEAQSYFEKALADHRAHGNKAFEANTLGALGRMLGNQKQDYVGAESCYRQVLRLNESLGRRRSAAVNLHGLAFTLFRQGRYEEARAGLREACDRFAQVGSMEGDRAAALKDLGMLELKVGRIPEAEQQCREAMGLALCHEKGMFLLQFFEDLRELHRQLGRPGLAIFFGKQAVSVLQERREALKDLEESDRTSFVQGYAGHYRALADLLLGQGRVPEAEEVLALLKEQEFRGFGTGPQKASSQRLSLTATEAKWAKAFQSLQDRLLPLSEEKYKLGVLSSRNPKDETRGKELDRRLQDGQAELLRGLEDCAKDFARADAARDWKDLAGLKTGLEELGEGVVALQTLVAEDRLYVILTHKGERRVVTRAIPAKDVATLAQDLRLALQNPDVDPRRLGGRLYDLLLGGLQQDLDRLHARTLVWSQDGVLRYVPMSALWDGRHYLVERYRNVTITLASRSRLKPERESAWKVLGLGVTKAHEGFIALPSVRKELALVVREPGASQGALPGKRLLDEAFTWDSMRGQLAYRYPVVHVASHFEVSPGNEYASFLLAGDGGHISLAEIRKREGLFAGVDLLTLSACKTALGTRNADGKEVDGFAEIAQQEGAKAVVASLWSVDDESTQELMVAFYRERKKAPASGKAEALRRAQLSLLRPASAPQGGWRDPGGLSEPEFTADPKAPFAHPYYWAPFILMGNWR